MPVSKKKLFVNLLKRLGFIIVLVVFLYIMISFFYRGRDVIEFLQNLFIFFSILIFIGAVVGIYSSLSILRFIKRLNDSISEFTKGDMDVEFYTERGDELGELAQKVEKMRDRIKKLLQTRIDVEEILRIRLTAHTKKIIEEGERLKEEVKQKTKELRGRVDELERFHKVTLERELRMKDLEEEIAELKKGKKNSKINFDKKNNE